MRIFKKVIDLIIKLLIPLVILALLLGMARIVVDLRSVFGTATVGTVFDLMITNILSMFVVIELLRSIIEYFEIHRFKLTYITDAAVVFILRELMIGIYGHSLDAWNIGALSLLLLVLGIIRTMAIMYSPDRTREATAHD